MRAEHKNKTILITGSTDGVGRRVATMVAGPDVTVLLHGRDFERGQAVVADVEKAGGRGLFYPADFSSLAGVRQLAAAVSGEHDHLDALINNAGIGPGQRQNRREESGDGYELRLAVNYLSGFLLTHLMLPQLGAAGSGRIVNVASAGQQALDFDNLMLERGYSGTRAYCQSKLAQILFTFDLARRLERTGIAVNCLHPASYMDTTMVRADGISPASTVEEGASAIVSLLRPAAGDGRSGLYFDGLRPSRALAQAYDADACARLFRISLDLAGLSEQAGTILQRA